MNNEIANNAMLISSFVKGSVVEMHILGISAAASFLIIFEKRLSVLLHFR